MTGRTHCTMGHAYPGGRQPPGGCAVCAEQERRDFEAWHQEKLGAMASDHAAIRARSPDMLRIHVVATGQTRVIGIPRGMRRAA